jgi:hypothetical protein
MENEKYYGKILDTSFKVVLESIDWNNSICV